MNPATLQRVITTYNPVLNGHQYSGFGSWTSVITATIQAGVAVGTLAYQAKLTKQAQHAEERRIAAEREYQLNLAKAQAAAMQAQQEQLAAEATGGAVALDAHGKPINASGVVSGGPVAGVGLSRNTLLIGGVAVGIGALLLIGLAGRRRR